MAHSRRIRCDGADPDYIWFSTPSWSRPRSAIVHTITIDKRKGWVRCSCEDATCRKKKAYLMDVEAPTGCKHIRSLLTHYRSLILGEMDV